MAYDVDTIEALLKTLHERLQEDLFAIITILNREERLEDWLNLMGMSDLIESKKEETYGTKTGRIIVIGESRVKKNVLESIMEEMGIDKHRLSCCLEYHDIKHYHFRNHQWNLEDAIIFVGSMGHKAEAIDGYSSPIAMMEQESGYPPVLRLEESDHSLANVTKSNFRNGLQKAIDEGIISVDHLAAEETA